MDIQSFPIHPDLEDTTMFSLQHRHWSSTICVDPNVLTCWHRFPQAWVLDDHVRSYIIQLGFYAFHQVGHVQIDWPLITTLVERWRLKTHIPYASWWDDYHITRCSHLIRITCAWSSCHWYYSIDWHALCEELLGDRDWYS